MIITVSKEKLKEIVQIVRSICPRKTDINILNYFYLEAKDEECSILATDLEINYQTKFPARIEKEGKILIPAKQFENIVDNLYEEDVTLEVNGDILYLRGKKFFLNLPGLSQTDFPTFSPVIKDKFFEIDNEIFLNVIEKFKPILKTSDIRPEFAGVYFDLTTQGLNLVVTDSFRLAYQKIKNIFYETNLDKISVLIPLRLIKEYLGLKKKGVKLRIYFEESQISFEVGNHLFTSKIIALDYPDYKGYLEQNNFLFTIEIEKEEVLKALKLNKVYAGDLKELEVIFNFDEQKLYLISRNELLGEVKNEIDFDLKENNFNRNEFKLKFNTDFFYDGFDSFEAEKVLVNFFSASEDTFPLYLTSPAEEDFIYISMHL
ncbi:DNA polymerase III subunit beta [bacterium HR35]|nr:DNA polymerase III subunit beta [bacterium HR35]